MPPYPGRSGPGGDHQGPGTGALPPSSPPPPWCAAELPELPKEMLKSPEEAQELDVTQAVKLMEETALRGETTKQEDDAELLKEIPLAPSSSAPSRAATSSTATSSTTECPGTCRSCRTTTGHPRTSSLSSDWTSPRKRTR